MGTIKATVAVSGTDDNGNTRSFSANGTFQAFDVAEGDMTVSTTKAIISGGNYPSVIYLENYGTVDVAVGWVDTSNNTYSYVVPPDAAILISNARLDGATNVVTVWTAASTSSIRYALFF